VDAEEEREDQEDNQAHRKDGTESKSEEQQEANANFRDQDHSESSALHGNDHTKDNGAGQINQEGHVKPSY